VNDSASARTAIRRIPGLLVAGLLLAIAATVGALGYQSPARSSSNAASSMDVGRSERLGTPGEADGAVPDGTTVFDDAIPAVANLDPSLLGALRRAATAAAADGVCQIYANEPWHCELRLEAIDHGCPPMYGDPTHDPRMQQ
jgi:D-alanyl-D-alanine carboxypeptidase